VFWKLVEALVRLIYFRRFRAVERIGKAGELLDAGRAGESLRLLERVGRSMHESLLPFWAFTRGRVLVALDRFDEAEQSLKLAVLSDRESGRADLELAVLCGRRGRLEEAREWLERLEAKDDEQSRAKGAQIRALLEKVGSGERTRELAERARELAERPLPPGGSPAGLPPDPKVLDGWIRTEPDQARAALDEIALLVAFGEERKGARFEVNLSLEDSAVVRNDEARLNPFETVARCIDEGIPLAEALKSGYR
jgi:tetratricopeptide (TPR) repeat protein